MTPEDLFKIQPWKTIEVFKQLSEQLKATVPISETNLKITQYTTIYEDKLRELWEAFKKDPAKQKARELADFMKEHSAEIWAASALSILGLSQLTPQQQDLLDRQIAEHHDYIENSLLPDLLKAIAKGVTDFSNFDYRVIFLYAGALWAFGSLISVTFDGVNLRDAADLFLFAGPNDENTCEGERGCKQFANNIYTVAEILARQIIPGRLRCGTSCRHMLIPIASPLK